MRGVDPMHSKTESRIPLAGEKTDSSSSFLNPLQTSLILKIKDVFQDKFKVEKFIKSFWVMRATGDAFLTGFAQQEGGCEMKQMTERSLERNWVWPNAPI